MNDRKDTNPKDAAASNRLPLALVPSTLQAFAAIAFAEGAAKYSAYNWRIAGVRGSVYLSAVHRHIALYTNGENADPKTGVPHLASAIAGIAIILDAGVCGKLNDDRPPPSPELCDWIRASEKLVASVRAAVAPPDAPAPRTAPKAAW